MPGYAPTSAPKSTLPTSTNLPQSRDVAIADFTSNTYVPFSILLTGDIAADANMVAVWSPKETRFVLRGGCIQVLCLTSCAGTPVGGYSFGELIFHDELTSARIFPITTYHITQTLAGWVNAITPWNFDLGKGYKSAAKNNRLRIGGSIGIGTGVFYCIGMLWGVQEL
jgi:hypothetical protein